MNLQPPPILKISKFITDNSQLFCTFVPDMRVIKRLDIFVLKNFLLLFVGTFCICMFAVMMQFLWKFVDELVGKGIDMWTMGKFFFYAACTLVPMALPLSILLTSLISFGNMGERLELLSIKAAGISLIRTFRSLILLMVLLTGVSFVFQNNISPSAERKFMQLLYSMRQKSPELDIPEGTFYSGIDGLNLYVHEKNKETGMLYTMMIYDMRQGISKAHILLADSGYLETSADKKYLLLHMFNGEQFENMQEGVLATSSIPYRRETFVEKHFLINFDTNMNMADENDFRSSASTKNLKEIAFGIDSLEHDCDSMSRELYAGTKNRALFVPRLDELKRDAELNETNSNIKSGKEKGGKGCVDLIVHLDTVYNHLPLTKQTAVIQAAVQKVQMQQQELQWGNGGQLENNDKLLRRHKVQFWQIITVSLSCLVFFFVGAPLGAIIRKGGLGMPVVVAVVVFIIYYMINTSGMKLSREGSIPAWIGMWVSTVVLAPLGVFLTVKSNNDSVVFNMDSYVIFFKKLFGIPAKRHIGRKEVIIDDPNYREMYSELQVLEKQVRGYRKEHHRQLQLIMIYDILRNKKSEDLVNISVRLENIVEILSNSKDRQILYALNEFPVLDPAPRFANRSRRECRSIAHTCKRLADRINELIGPIETVETIETIETEEQP